MEEARLFLNHPILNAHLREIVDVLLSLPTNDPESIFGKLDALKLKSSMTLFDAVHYIFAQILDKYFNGQRDSKSIKLIEKTNEIIR